MSEITRPKRRYDASGRRRRAAETRARVVAAATKVFLEHGYAGATIPMIAAEAGVALQTVYRAAPGKAGLLEAAVTAAVAGGSARAAVPVEERPAIRAVIDEPDPHRQLRLYAHTQPGIWSRVGPLLRVLEAAAVSEPELRRLQQRQDAQRHAGLTRFARFLADRGALRTGLTPERAADIIVTLGSMATYDSLVVTHAWTDEQYEDWLADSLQHALLD
ncbi:MAG TPA: helix-turn-helix domain-containing protein [Jiangellaceae bacterium]